MASNASMFVHIFVFTTKQGMRMKQNLKYRTGKVLCFYMSFSMLCPSS